MLSYQDVILSGSLISVCYLIRELSRCYLTRKLSGCYLIREWEGGGERVQGGRQLVAGDLLMFMMMVVMMIIVLMVMIMVMMMMQLVTGDFLRFSSK